MKITNRWRSSVNKED